MPGHLLHVGFNKAASKYLQAWFAAHPQLAFVQWGLAGFRNAYDIAAEAARPGGYRYRVTSFEGFVVPLDDYSDVGRTAATLTMAPEAQAAVCAMLRDLCGAATVLIVTRGFRAILFADYSQLVRNGAIASLDDYLGLVDRLGRAGAPLFAYDRIIALYRGAFGADNVVVLPYERLRDDPVVFIESLESRLGLDHCRPGPDRIHAGLTRSELYWYPRLSRFMRWLPDRFGWERPWRRYVAALLRGRWRRLANRLPPPRPGSVPGPEAIPAEFLERYRGAAESLRTLPEYRGLEAEYLLGDAAAASSRGGAEWSWTDARVVGTA